MEYSPLTRYVFFVCLYGWLASTVLGSIFAVWYMPRTHEFDYLKDRSSLGKFLHFNLILGSAALLFWVISFIMLWGIKMSQL